MSHARRGFRRRRRRPTPPESPTALFSELTGRAPSVPFLWAHQNEILEAYNDKHLNTQDIALELPTGTGKTLIGLLIAEFRRRRLEDRALYLAPTRQLAHQVGGLARQYGIPAEVCLAPAYEGMNRWMLGGRIAVTVYSSLFNVNPVFGIPNTIILDDAHAAEDYLADHWTVTVPRDSDAFQPLLEFVRPAIDEYRLADLLDDGARFTVRYDVDLVPTPSWWPHVDAIRELLDHHLARTDERFSWSVIRNHLQGCFLLLSWGHIAFRPLVPPTQTLDEFREADQCRYMSATLGAGVSLSESAACVR